MKPPGISMSLADGALRIGVTQSSRAVDAVWNAVEEAQASSMTVSQFIAEAREAWAYGLREQAKHDDTEFRRLK